MSAFADSLHEVFTALGRVQIRRMFGGQGVFHDGLMCALVMKGTLYLKCDAETTAHFDALNLPTFCYDKQGRSTALPYRQAPESVFEDREAAALWARLAFEAALRRANAKPLRVAGATPSKKMPTRASRVKKGPPPR